MAIMTPSSFARAPVFLLAALEAVVVYSSVYFAALITCGDWMSCNELVGPITVPAGLITGVILICLVAMGLYHYNQRLSYREVITRLFVGVSCGLFVVAALIYAMPSVSIPAESLLIAAIYTIVLLSVLRFLFLYIVDQNVFRRKILIVGTGQRASSINDLRRRADRRGFQVVATATAPYRPQDEAEDLSPSTDQSLLDLAVRLDVDEIVIAIDDRRGKLPVRELLDCRLHGIEVIDIIGFLERETGKIRADLVNPGWLIFSEGFRRTKIRLVTKRIMDVTLSMSALLIGWPLFLVTALAIKVEGGWRSPIFYRQERVGYNGIPFNVIKFRSMVVNAEKDGQPVWAIKNDDRITKVGSLIRKIRVDELPQIFNVLRGQMSLVGPRPERPEFVDKLSESIPYYCERHTVKPGITGWAQLKYSYGASEEDAVEKLHYDLYYIKHHTLLLDLLIILHTVEVVLWGKGAR